MERLTRLFKKNGVGLVQVRMIPLFYLGVMAQKEILIDNDLQGRCLSRMALR
jgi:hypothetical protein